MKTTIDLPEEVLRSAKVYAAEHQTTLKALVVKGLRAVTEEGGLEEENARKKRIRELLDQLRANNTEPMVPLSREELYDR